MTRDEIQKDMEGMTERAKAMLGVPEKKDEFKSLTEKIGTAGEQIRMMDKAEAEVRAAKEAEKAAPSPVSTNKGGWEGVRQQLKRAIENRGGSIDLSGIEHRATTQVLSNGAGNRPAPGIIQALVEGGKLRSMVSVFQGPNAITTVPVWAPTVALPVGSAPGTTGSAVDTTATLTGTALTLKAWHSTVQIGNDALLSTDVESALPSIFSKAFGGAIDKGILMGAGSGSDMLGVFIADAGGVTTSQDIVMASGTVASGPLWADYLGMMLTLIGLNGDKNSLAMVVNPNVFKLALAQAASGLDPLKNEYLMKGTILGCPIIMSGYAQSALTNDYYVAVGGYFDHYALAIAQEIKINQILTVCTDGVTFDAFMYMQGKPLVGSSFRRLQTTT